MSKKKRKQRRDITTPEPPRRRNKTILDIVATDRDFIMVINERGSYYVGGCIHCGTTLMVTLQGKTNATIEHIWPQCAGGSTTDLRNLALACKTCNNEKGIRHDDPNLDDRAKEVINALLERRKRRWKEV